MFILIVYVVILVLQINIPNEDVQSTEESKTEKVEIKWPPNHSM